MALDSADLTTETFTNSQGWTMVRVTHAPTGLVAERERTSERDSPVSAHAECLNELEERLGSGETATAAATGPVSREEFDALVARVEELERALSKARG